MDRAGFGANFNFCVYSVFVIMIYIHIYIFYISFFLLHFESFNYYVS